MAMSKKLNWLLAGAALTLVAGASVAAESKKDADKSERRIERQVIVRGDGPDVRVMRFKHRDPAERAEHLKVMLQLRPNQEAALKTYLEATAPNEDRVVRIDHKDDDKTTLQRLDEAEKRLAERQARLKKRNDATRAFYGQLDASQKKVFDTLPHMAGPGHMAMMRHPMPPMPMRHMRHMPIPPVPPVPPVPPEARD